MQPYLKGIILLHTLFPRKTGRRVFCCLIGNFNIFPIKQLMLFGNAQMHEQGIMSAKPTAYRARVSRVTLCKFWQNDLKASCYLRRYYQLSRYNDNEKSGCYNSFSGQSSMSLGHCRENYKCRYKGRFFQRKMRFAICRESGTSGKMAIDIFQDRPISESAPDYSFMLGMLHTLLMQRLMSLKCGVITIQAVQRGITV